MDRVAEFAAKQEGPRAFMDAHALDGALPRSRANTAWLGSGSILLSDDPERLAYPHGGRPAILSRYGAD